MSLEEYRERQRQAYLNRKRERELNGHGDDEEKEKQFDSSKQTNCSGARVLGGDDVQVSALTTNFQESDESSSSSSTALKTTSFLVPPKFTSATKKISHASPASSNDNPGLVSPSNFKELVRSTISTGETDTSSDALLAQLLSDDLASPKGKPSDDVDEASAAVIAQLIASDENGDESGVRVPDAAFQERLISDFRSPVRPIHDVNSCTDVDLPDDEIARRLQEEEFMRDDCPSSPRLGSTILIPPRDRIRLHSEEGNMKEQKGSREYQGDYIVPVQFQHRLYKKVDQVNTASSHLQGTSFVRSHNLFSPTGPSNTSITAATIDRAGRVGQDHRGSHDVRQTENVSSSEANQQSVHSPIVPSLQGRSITVSATSRGLPSPAPYLSSSQLRTHARTNPTIPSQFPSPRRSFPTISHKYKASVTSHSSSQYYSIYNPIETSLTKLSYRHQMGQSNRNSVALPSSSSRLFGNTSVLSSDPLLSSGNNSNLSQGLSIDFPSPTTGSANKPSNSLSLFRSPLNASSYSLVSHVQQPISRFTVPRMPRAVREQPSSQQNATDPSYIQGIRRHHRHSQCHNNTTKTNQGE